MSTCKRCGGKLAYPGAEYCGAACSAQRGEPVHPDEWPEEVHEAIRLLKSKGVTDEDYARFLAASEVSP